MEDGKEKITLSQKFYYNYREDYRNFERKQNWIYTGVYFGEFLQTFSEFQIKLRKKNENVSKPF